jgi:hypothetical protein
MKKRLILLYIFSFYSIKRHHYVKNTLFNRVLIDLIEFFSNKRLKLKKILKRAIKLTNSDILKVLVYF